MQNSLVRVCGSFGHGSVCREWVQDHRDTIIAEFTLRIERSLSKFGNVGEKRDLSFQKFVQNLVLFQLGECLCWVVLLLCCVVLCCVVVVLCCVYIKSFVGE